MPADGLILRARETNADLIFEELAQQRSLILRSIAKRCVSKECAEHDRQLGGESPLSSLMAAKD
jgi:hypothetical protein